MMYCNMPTAIKTDSCLGVELFVRYLLIEILKILGQPATLERTPLDIFTGNAQLLYEKNDCKDTEVWIQPLSEFWWQLSKGLWEDEQLFSL